MYVTFKFLCQPIHSCISATIEVLSTPFDLSEQIQWDIKNDAIIDTITTQREWLLEWKQPVKPPSLPDNANKIFTPLKLPAWAEALRNYPSEEVALFFLTGIAHGFRIGFIPSSTSLKSAAWNLEGASSHPQVVEEYLREEVSLGRVAGPLPPSL